MRLIPEDSASRQPFPCLSCTARGLQCLLCCLRSGELLPPRFTLTRAETQAVCFLLHFPSAAPCEYGVSRFHGTRCLAVSGLSSIDTKPTATARTRTTPPVYKAESHLSRLFNKRLAISARREHYFPARNLLINNSRAIGNANPKVNSAIKLRPLPP